jgi:hypothetical protein
MRNLVLLSHRRCSILLEIRIGMSVIARDFQCSMIFVGDQKSAKDRLLETVIRLACEVVCETTKIYPWISAMS